MTVLDTTSSRGRLLQSARQLFAENGYEGTSTASIARMAATSESQLIKHFGGKAGLLEAVFVTGWNEVLPRIKASLTQETSALEKLRRIPRAFGDALEATPDLRVLVLLEGRRIRKEGRQMTLTDGFTGYVELLDEILTELETTGVLRPSLSKEAVRSAIVGMTEGALRDRVLAERTKHSPYTAEQLGQVVDALISAITLRSAAAA